jgi:hypothetical protein
VAVKEDLYRHSDWPSSPGQTRVLCSSARFGLRRFAHALQGAFNVAPSFEQHSIRRGVSARRYITHLVESVGEPVTYVLSDHVAVKSAPVTTPSAVSAR